MIENDAEFENDAVRATQPRDLPAPIITPEGFAPFGHLILPTADGAPAGLIDRALDLSQGTPRFYIMDLSHRSLDIVRITRHRAATQVLASANARPWMLAVAPPGAADAPALDDIRGFVIPGGVAVLLHRGTWHAGPYFRDATMPFFNLELIDTNVVDHHTVMLKRPLRLAEAAA